MNLQKTKILRMLSKGILVLTGLFLLGFLGWTVYRGVKFRPYKVRVTNVTDSAFTVSWVTDSPMPGIVYYGEKNTFLPGPLAWLGKKKAVDDRDFSNTQGECISKFNKEASKNKDENFTVDASGFNCNDIKVWKYGKYYTHHITVQNLEAEKEYFFRVGDGFLSYSKGKTEGVVYVEREIPEVENFKQKTLPVITKVEAPNPAYGTSYNVYYREDGTMGEKKNFDSLIFLKTYKDGEVLPYLSSVTNSSGGWTIDLSNVRKADGTVVPMDGASLEFIPQVENAKPGASGESNYEDTGFPLNLLGNTIEELEETKGVSSSVLRDLFVKDALAIPIVGGSETTCWDGCNAVTVRNNTCQEMGYNTKPASCKINCYYCDGDILKTESKTSCTGKYSTTAPNCTQTTPLKKCYYCDGDILKTESKTDCTGNYSETIKSCSTTTICQGEMVSGDPVRGGCQNGNNYCYIPRYHKFKDGTRGELCEYIKTTSATCGHIACGDKDLLKIGVKGWTGEGLCNNGGGCECKDGGNASFNSECAEIVKCYFPSNCNVAVPTTQANCDSGKGTTNKSSCVPITNPKKYSCYNISNCYSLGLKTESDCEKSQGVMKIDECGKSGSQVSCYLNNDCEDFVMINEAACTIRRGTTDKSKCSSNKNEEENVSCAIFNTHSQECESVKNKNWCEDYREYIPGYYYVSLIACENKHPKVETEGTDNGKCYDRQNFSLISCSSCSGNCIVGDVALQKILDEKERKGFVFVPLEFNKSIVQVYIDNDDYQDWLSSCIQGSSSKVDFSYLSSPETVRSGIPSCPKVEFEYIPGKQLGDKAIYNYDTLDKIWKFMGLGTLTAGVAKLVIGGGGAAVTGATAATQIATAMGASVTETAVVSASSLLNSALASAGVSAPTANIFHALVAKIAAVMSGPGGLAAAKIKAWELAANVATMGSAATGGATAAGGATAIATAGGTTVPLLTAGSGSTALATVGTGSTALATAGTGGTAITTTGGAVATAAGGVGAGTIAAGVVGVAVVALGVDALAHRENVYEQCATVVDGVIKYSIQQKYCERNRTGAKWESVPCECNGVRTELTGSTTPVFNINYYLNSNGTFEACAGNNCNNQGTQLNMSSKTAINVNGKELICCYGASPKTAEECCPGVSPYQAQQYCATEWGKCVKVDKVSISSFLPLNSHKKELANLEEKSWNSLSSIQSDKQLSSGKLLKEAHAEEVNEQKFLYSDSGLYEVSFVGGMDNYLIKEGDTSLFYYLERNGITGYQTPENPFEPKDNEDLAVTESSVIISAERQTSLQTLNLKKGINIISFNYVPTLGENGGTLTSDSFLKIANNTGNNVSRISFFSAGQWNGGTSYDFEKAETKGVPFNLVVGKGYVVIAEQDCSVFVPSYELTSSVPLSFSSGWNLVGVHGQQEAYTAKTFIESINTIEGLKANNVTWWPTSRGMYQGYQLQNGQEYGQDFPISPINGYFVRIAEFTPKEDTCKSLIWNPSGEMNGECGSNN